MSPEDANNVTLIDSSEGSCLVLIMAIILIGLSAGWIAHLLVGRGRANWPQLFVVGLAGSLVGGLLGSLLLGDGLELRPSGIIGSALGATVILLAMRAAGAGSQRGTQPK